MTRVGKWILQILKVKLNPSSAEWKKVQDLREIHLSQENRWGV